MRGRKYELWVAVISAALLTAGMSLSCADEDNGAAVNCQDACEKLDACWGDPYPFGYTVAECVDTCEQELAGAVADLREGLAEAFACISDTVCDDIMGDCFCKPACQKLADCDILFFPSMTDCVGDCDDDWQVWQILYCLYGLSSCELIFWCIGF
jgi:hypothetical protein